jgi:hypothetical protein
MLFYEWNLVSSPRAESRGLKTYLDGQISVQVSALRRAQDDTIMGKASLEYE